MWPVIKMGSSRMDMACLIGTLGLTARQFNAAGLAVGFLGALILAFWGTAGWEVTSEGYMRSPGCKVPIGAPGRERAVLWLKVRFVLMPKVGLLLVAIAFLAQLCALWAPGF
jgi:hypothetical protein